MERRATGLGPYMIVPEMLGALHFGERLLNLMGKRERRRQLVFLSTGPKTLQKLLSSSFLRDEHHNASGFKSK